MQVAMGSIFRNSTSYIDRYVAQVEGLRAAAPQHSFRCILAEGDSSDDSYNRLKARFDGSVFKRSHGGPVFGSVDSPQRYRQFSFCYEGVLERVRPEDEVFVYVESDLIWDAATILKLVDHLSKPGVDMVSPFCWYPKENRVYDVWGQRAKNGDLIGFFPPHHASFLDEPVNGLRELSASGSCIVMKAEVARRAHFDPADMCVVGFCWNARSLGYSLWLDPKLKVFHPE